MSDNLTEDQAVYWLAERGVSVCKTTLRAERAEGKIMHLRVRRRVFYPVAGLQAYLNKVTCPAIDSPSGLNRHTGRSLGSMAVHVAVQRAKRAVTMRKPFSTSSSAKSSTPDLK